MNCRVNSINTDKMARILVLHRNCKSSLVDLKTKLKLFNTVLDEGPLGWEKNQVVIIQKTRSNCAGNKTKS